MNFSISREDFLEVLVAAGNVSEKRQNKPILAHVLVVAADGQVVLTGTDEEIEIVTKAYADVREPGAIAVPGRKLLDIVRTVPVEAEIRVVTDGNRLRLLVGKSRFVLSTMPAEDFPNLIEVPWEVSLSLSRGELRRVIEKTHFCMAQQDVRYYLNGLMLEVLSGSLKAVAADGHRLALCSVEVETREVGEKQVILPRKAVTEMMRFLGNDGGPVEMAFSTNHVRLKQDELVFVSKLIDGRFPDYHRVIPATVKEEVVLPRGRFKEMLTRVGIVSGDKMRGIRLEFRDNLLVGSATNREHDEAQEEMVLDEEMPPLEIGFNVNYLLEAVSALEGDEVRFAWNGENSACRLVAALGEETQVYVVMPVRL